MVAELVEYKPSCKLPFVTLGIQLQTAMYNPVSINYYKYTTSENVKVGYCLNCGNPFFKNVMKVKHNLKFCSHTCASKYNHNKIKEENLKIAYKNVNKNEFEIFYKKYSNFVFAKIYEQDHIYTEDLYDWWNEQAIRMFYCIRKWEIENGREGNKFAFLKKAVIFATQNIKAKRQHEVFYDECNVKTQQMILGNYNSIYD